MPNDTLPEPRPRERGRCVWLAGAVTLGLVILTGFGVNWWLTSQKAQPVSRLPVLAELDSITPPLIFAPMPPVPERGSLPPQPAAPAPAGAIGSQNPHRHSIVRPQHRLVLRSRQPVFSRASTSASVSEGGATATAEIGLSGATATASAGETSWAAASASLWE